jgi:hypothetical protein
MLNGMQVKPYKVNLDKDYEALKTFLQERNPKTADTIEE